MLPVAILAGGLATRLHPFTENVPKSLLDVAGQPFLLRQLDLLQSQRVDRVVICAGHLGEQIQSRVGDGTEWGLAVAYSFDRPVLLGTGGALRRALPLLGDTFFVMYGDSYLPVDFGAIEAAFAEGAQPALMTVLRNAGRWDRSNVEFRDNALVRYDKRNPGPGMAHIDYGLSVLSAEVVGSAAAEEAFDLAELYSYLSQRGLLGGYEVFERFYEIGSASGLKETIEYFKGREAS